MKKQRFLMVTLVLVFAVLFSLVPLNTALAKMDNTLVNLKIRNRTGGIVELKLVDENGNPSWFRYEPGQTLTPLPEGIYAYYASTDCGNRSGVFNINVTKELLFSCGAGLEIALNVPSGKQFCYPVFDYEEPIFSDPGTDGAAAVVDFNPFPWGQIGTHCQPTAANPGDTIVFYNPYYDDSFDYYYELDGIECYQGGNGFYYEPCPDKPQ